MEEPNVFIDSGQNNYLRVLQDRNIQTFSALASMKNYKFINSWNKSPLPNPSTLGLGRSNWLLPRGKHVEQMPIEPVRKAVGAYWDALKTVVADLIITEEEVQYIVAERKRLGLKKEQVRVLHARAFASAIAQFVDDQWLDDKEVLKLHRLKKCLSKLGWAPGDRPVARRRPTISPKGRSYTIIQVEQRTSEWLSWRQEGIGASDAPIVMGENLWKNVKTLLQEKRGIQRDHYQNAAMARGIRLEPEARKRYESETGVSVQPACLQSCRYDWLRASVDGLSADGRTVVEIKCGDSVYSETATYGKVPDYYYGQVQHILAVTGNASIDFWCWLPGHSGILVKVERDAKYIKALIEAELSFWKQVNEKR